MHIDESKGFTPWRNLKSGKRFSDHCAIKFSMNLNEMESLGHAKSSKRIKVWNFNGPEDWTKFCTLTKSLDVPDMWSVGKNIEDTYQTWKRKLNNALHKWKKLKSKLAVSFSNANGFKQNVRKLDTVID